MMGSRLGSRPQLVNSLGSPIGPRLHRRAALGTFTTPDGETWRANHDDRRRLGQRGKPRRLRRREMPGAVERRIERNRKAWSA